MPKTQPTLPKNEVNNQWLHLLGTAKISDFFMLQQLQKSLNSVGSNMRVTTDSSSPDTPLALKAANNAPV